MIFFPSWNTNFIKTPLNLKYQARISKIKHNLKRKEKKIARHALSIDRLDKKRASRYTYLPPFVVHNKLTVHLTLEVRPKISSLTYRRYRYRWILQIATSLEVVKRRVNPYPADAAGATMLFVYVCALKKKGGGGKETRKKESQGKLFVVSNTCVKKSRVAGGALNQMLLTTTRALSAKF